MRENKELCALIRTMEESLGFGTTVHIAGFPANKSLVSLNFTAELPASFTLHCKSNPVKHEPRGLLGNTDSTMNLPRANAVFAIGNHPDGRQPFVESER